MRSATALVSALALASCGDAGARDDVAQENTKLVVAATDDQATAKPEVDADATTDAAAPPVACQTGEDPLFLCTAAGGQTIAVCGKDGNAQYRFGGSNVELTLDNGKFASVGYSGGGEAQIAFSNGDTSYIVFSRTVRTNFAANEPNNPEFTDGVAVVRGDKVIAERLCTDETDSVDVMAGENYGGVADEVFF